MESLTRGENVSLGIFVALSEGLLLQPTLYWKNAQAQGLPLSIDPRVLYRGVGVSLINEVGQMSLEFGVTGYLKAMFRREPPPSEDCTGAAASKHDDSATATLAAAVGGGLVGGVFASPIELVMIQQQLSGGSARRVLGQLVGGPGGLGTLTRGMFAALGRDGIYTTGMLGLTPVIQGALVQHAGLEVYQASMAASLVGGVLAALLSHPFDVIKTCMQGDAHGLKYRSFFHTLTTLRRQGTTTTTTTGAPAAASWARLWRGVAWRTFNITTTVYIANEACNRLPPYITRLTRTKNE